MSTPAERLERAVASMNRFALTVTQARDEALERDPGLRRHLERARAIDPDIGWLDVAAYREGHLAVPHVVKMAAEERPEEP